MSSALEQVLEQVEPPGAEATEAARQRLAGREGLGNLASTALTLAGARHVALPPVNRKMIIVCAADHGVAAEADGAALANEIAAGAATVNVFARAAGAQVTIVDCGVRDPSALIDGVTSLAIAPGTSDLRAGPAMTGEQALAAFETGVALTLSVAGSGLDLIALGQAGAGGDRAAAAVVASLREGTAPVDALACCGGFDIGVLAGVCVAASVIRIPIVLDGTVVPAAALLAVRMAPATAGYLLAGHAGESDTDRAALAAVGLEPIGDLGVTAGCGAGAAAVLPVIDAAARLLREPVSQKRLPIVRDH